MPIRWRKSSPYSQYSPNPPLPQQIYRVEHEKLGELEIFLVPIAVDQYQAVFT